MRDATLHHPVRTDQAPWDTPMPRCPRLRGRIVTDVCIVGAGMAGLSVAYQLSRRGIQVAVVDAGRVGFGETGCTTAHLVTALDRRYFELLRYHGAEGVRRIADSHRQAIDTIEATAEKEDIHCDFARVDGHLVGVATDADETLARELQAARLAGLDAVEHLPDCPVPAFARHACLRFPRQARFHPLKYLRGLAKAVKRNGGRIFTNTRIKEISAGPATFAAGEHGERIQAKFIVVATNTPAQNLVTMHTKQAAYRTYVLGLHMPAAALFDELVWDTEDPFHYVRCHPSLAGNGKGDGMLIVGGEDHKTGQGEGGEGERFERLEAWARERFPEAGDIAHRWSGQIMESNDGIAYIGRNPGEDNVFIATGDSGVGMTHGTIAGLLVSDLILGRDNDWTTVYDPARKQGAWEFTKENLNVAWQYFDWLTGGDVKSRDDIPPDTGAVLRRGLSKIACYRDADGKFHELSATCPHLGCIVAWNDAERSWDCPCHGSRFDVKGKVLNGPALGNLQPPADEA